MKKTLKLFLIMGIIFSLCALFGSEEKEENLVDEQNPVEEQKTKEELKQEEIQKKQKEREKVKHRTDKNIVGVSNKDVNDITSMFSESVRNDKTDKWRLLTVAQNNIDLTEYALSIYDNYWDDECTIIAVENLTTKTSYSISNLGEMLEINIYEYVDGEEHDADIMFSGMFLSKYWVYLDNGDIEKIQ